MSVEAITWALGQPVKPSAAKFVLVALADCANKESFVAWPSIPALVESTCQDRKTVIANLARLRELGYIEDTGERKGVTSQIVVYRLKSPTTGTVPSADEEPDSGEHDALEESQKRNSTESGTVPDSPSNSTVFPQEQYRFSPETVPNTGHGTGRTVIGTGREPKDKTRTPKRTPSAERPSANELRPEGLADAVWRDFLAIRKAKRAPWTETAWRGLSREARIAGLTDAEAVVVCCERSWQSFNAGWYGKSSSVSGSTARRQSAANRNDNATAEFLGQFFDDGRTIDA